MQSTEDPTRFVLVEVYRSADAPAAHKATAHYARWRDAVAAADGRAAHERALRQRRARRRRLVSAHARARRARARGAHARRLRRGRRARRSARSRASSAATRSSSRGATRRARASSSRRSTRPACARRRFAVAGEPTVDVARAGVAAARGAGCDLVVAFGGGSALDAGKAIAALLGNGGDPLDYLEVVGRGQPLTRPSLPTIAIPTTAGTGSEVTKNAVLASPEHGVKASLRSPLMLPRVALVDPDLLARLPAPVVASSGLDALSQLIEPLVSIRATPATDVLAREGIRRVGGRAPSRLRRGARGRRRSRPPIARRSRSRASTAASASRTPASAPCTASRRPSAACSPRPTAPCAPRSCPPCCASTRAPSRTARPTAPALARLREVAALVTGRADATIDDGVAWLAELVAALEIPGLARHGLSPARIPELVGKARVASSMKGNPIVLSDDELAEIATASL